MFRVNEPKFRKLIEHGIPLERLVKRLQPELCLKNRDAEKRKHDGFGDYSDEGFLGRDESLLDVVHDDWEIVEKYGTTHQEIAKALAKSIKEVKVPNPKYTLDYQFATAGFQSCPWGCNGRYQKGCGIILIYHVKKTSQEDLMAINYAVMMDNKIGKEIEAELGRKNKRLASFLRNIPKDISGLTDRVAVVTELHPHLIGEHYFFEGKESPYRADPAFLINALGLAGQNK